MKQTLEPFTHEQRNTPIRTGRIGDREYTLMLDGSIHRLSPERPWRGKSERRRHLRARRIQRQWQGVARTLAQ